MRNNMFTALGMEFVKDWGLEGRQTDDYLVVLGKMLLESCFVEIFEGESSSGILDGGKEEYIREYEGLTDTKEYGYVFINKSEAILHRSSGEHIVILASFVERLKEDGFDLDSVGKEWANEIEENDDEYVKYIDRVFNWVKAKTGFTVQ